MAETINHSGRAHALLSASGAYRWMACTPSARFTEDLPDKESFYGKEGTLAHEFSEHVLRYKLGFTTKKEMESNLDQIRLNDLYSDEMDEQVDKYVNHIMEEYHHLIKTETLKPKAYIEKGFDLSHWIEEGFGTNDFMMYGGEVLHIFDLKYGKGIPVKADNNPQLKLYALGALMSLGEKAKKINRCILTIVQPRLDSISTWEIDKDKLLFWANTDLKDKAELAYNGEGEFVAGDHCKFCKGKAICKAMYNFSLQQAKLDFSEELNPELDLKFKSNTMNDDDLLTVHANSPIIQDWLKTVSQYLIDRALAGDQFDGFKLVEGQKRRKVKDISGAEETLEMFGFSKDQTHKTSLKGIGDLEKLLLKDFKNIMGEHIGFSQSPPQLVKISVNRRSYRSAKAKDDFGSEPLPK